MKTFLEVEGKMGPIPQPTSTQYRPPQLDTNPKVRRTMLWRKGRGQHPQKGLGLAQSPSLVKQLHNHLQLFPKLQPMPNPKQMLQRIGPHP